MNGCVIGGSQMSELQTMQDALDIVKDIQVGDLVQGEVLVLQDKQAIVGIIGGGVEGDYFRF